MTDVLDRAGEVADDGLLPPDVMESIEEKARADVWGLIKGLAREAIAAGQNAKPGPNAIKFQFDSALIDEIIESLAACRATRLHEAHLDTEE